MNAHHASTRRSRQRIRNVAVLFALIVAVVGPGCEKAKDPPRAGPARTAATGIGGASGRYVGSETCRTCHATEFAAWSKSRHRSTLRPWSNGQLLQLASSDIPSLYRVSKDGTVVGPGIDGKEVTAHVAFLVGGRHREDAWVRLPDGRLQVFPISFDADSGKTFEPLKQVAGGAPPPPDVIEFWTRVGRNADIACYGCHATGQTVNVAAQSPSGLTLPASKWVEPGVGCEACHGPGGPHVDAAKDGKPAPETVKMGRGDARAMVDLVHQMPTYPIKNALAGQRAMSVSSGASTGVPLSSFKATPLVRRRNASWINQASFSRIT